MSKIKERDFLELKFKTSHMNHHLSWFDCDLFDNVEKLELERIRKHKRFIKRHYTHKYSKSINLTLHHCRRCWSFKGGRSGVAIRAKYRPKWSKLHLSVKYKNKKWIWKKDESYPET